jgi:hypothetical protein
MPNNKRSEAERLANPNPSERDQKRTPSDDADKSGVAYGKRHTKAHDKGAATETRSNRPAGGRQ